ncbi:MAG: PglZ domain-containing protein [Senegalia sp. (in: firmicutes)]|uniref:PglZ domain-containing protein n=1 Tax=Senegalia sp. (in: firmicutes) TaxID=1924098 RepID=UPI003F991B95
MFMDKIKNFLGLAYKEYILVKDFNNIFKQAKIIDDVEAEGFTIIHYRDVEEFRYTFESQIKSGILKKVIVLLTKNMYIAYDVQVYFSICILDYGEIFPRLNKFVLRKVKALDWDHVSVAYDNTYQDYSSETMTHKFLTEIIYQEDQLSRYLLELEDSIDRLLKEASNYSDWFQIAYLNARRNLIIGKLNLDNKNSIDFSRDFHNYIFNNYGKLSGRSTYKGPILVSKVMDFLLRKKSKVAFVVIDGMSISDWLILEKYLNFKVDMNFVFAMIPTITSISRQSLLGGILPNQVEKPYLLTNEKKQYYNKAGLYLEETSIKFFRGYDIDISYKDFFITTIINKIDDLVHKQMYGMEGHITNVVRMGESGNLNKLIKKLLESGFDVYIGSDHGNKESLGIGRPIGMGIEVETKSQKMIILKDYAKSNELVEKYNLIEYPGYYLPKDYNYLICQDDEALAIEGDRIMSHGGISIEEIIVPFIRVEGEEKDE